MRAKKIKKIKMSDAFFLYFAISYAEKKYQDFVQEKKVPPVEIVRPIESSNDEQTYRRLLRESKKNDSEILIAFADPAKLLKYNINKIEEDGYVILGQLLTHTSFLVCRRGNQMHRRFMEQ